MLNMAVDLKKFGKLMDFRAPLKRGGGKQKLPEAFQTRGPKVRVSLFLSQLGYCKHTKKKQKTSGYKTLNHRINDFKLRCLHRHGCDPPNPPTGLWSTIAKCLAQRGRTLKVGEFWKERCTVTNWDTQGYDAAMHAARPLSEDTYMGPSYYVNCPTMHPNFRLHQHTLHIWGTRWCHQPKKKVIPKISLFWQSFCWSSKWIEAPMGFAGMNSYQYVFPWKSWSNITYSQFPEACGPWSLLLPLAFSSPFFTPGFFFPHWCCAGTSGGGLPRFGSRWASCSFACCQ